MSILVGLVTMTACGSQPARPKGPPPEYEEPTATASANPTANPTANAIPSATAKPTATPSATATPPPH